MSFIDVIFFILTPYSVHDEHAISRPKCNLFKYLLQQKKSFFIFKHEQFTIPTVHDESQQTNAWNVISLALPISLSSDAMRYALSVSVPVPVPLIRSTHTSLALCVNASHCFEAIQIRRAPCLSACMSAPIQSNTNTHWVDKQTVYP